MNSVNLNCIGEKMAVILFNACKRINIRLRRPRFEHRALIGMRKENTNKLTSVATGHWLVGVHAERIGIPSNRFCQIAMAQTQGRKLNTFTASAKIRLKTLGQLFLQINLECNCRSLYDILKIGFAQVCGFEVARIG